MRWGKKVKVVTSMKGKKLPSSVLLALVCLCRQYGREVSKKEVREALAFTSGQGDGTVLFSF